MSRRGLTFLVAGLLTAALGLLATVLPVPYVVLVPGPVTDTLGSKPAGDGPLVSVRGARTYDVGDGHLYLTTVGVLPGSCDDHPTLWQAVQAWFDDTEAVQPHQVICPPDKSSDDVERENEQDMELSQRDAITAALFELGRKPVSQEIIVKSVVSGTPAAKVLQAGDVLVRVDGRDVVSADQLREAVGEHEPGDTLDLTIRRDGVTTDETVRTVDAGDGTGRTLIGVDLDRRATFRGVRVKVGVDPARVGGPSAGLAFALAIVDRLTAGELTGGRTIASTGTIDGYGAVGAIGGIQQKIAGAVDQGATVFLVPAENCADAKDVAPSSLTLVRVTTLHSAVTALEALSDGTGSFDRC
jgi:PDZ domain-containing protein